MSHGPTVTEISANPLGSCGPGDSASTSPSSPVTRSASYAQLPLEQPQTFPARTDSLRRSFSENVLANGVSSVATRSSTHEDYSALEKTDLDTGTHPTIAQFSLGDDDVIEEPRDLAIVDGSEHAESWEPVSSPPRLEDDNKTSTERGTGRRFVPGSISNFARRKSWIATSRSPSPSPSHRTSRMSKEPTSHPNDVSEESWPLPQLSQGENSANGTLHTVSNGIAKKDSLLGRKSRRPLSSLLGKDALVHLPSIPPVPRSYSTDRLPSLRHKRSTLSDAPPLPRSTSYEKLHGPESPRKKDELWGVFRTLDGEYSKFQSRPSTTKTAVVRSSLLPFLKTYADQPSISHLRPEDLDRRSVILNKWWTGLLEMLNGRYGESVSGNDRPAILEAATALMVRPEWTAPPPPVQLRSARGPRASLKSRSTTSLGSNMSDFLVDSVFHNIKNIFTQNLLAQMAYVVQKMSMRNAAASVVTFCGKATAYAFYYCDGVAAILVRLWAIPTATIARVLAEYGLARTDKLDAVCDRVCSSYPSCIQPLGFKSLHSTARYLRSRLHLPIATTHIPWHGPWTSRWAGKDTDLFFVFVKQFTDLTSRYMPDGTSIEERITSPAWALVQAQILTIMRNIVQRSSQVQPAEHLKGHSSTNFEEMIGEADAAATLLPLPVNGAVRSMAENRLVMLLRDCLANSNLMTDKARELFADMFNRLLKATARHTSVFDHHACFTLCDLLEEAMIILLRYPQPIISRLDWGFWLEVCKQMLHSQNSMTEVRLFAFLFSMWGSITKDAEVRRKFCLDWLLSEDTFHSEFSHWCPMVRAFFMRLLIWKLARPSSEDSDLDHDVLHALRVRLEEVWQGFLHVEHHAESTGQTKPSVAPCSPAPSRQLLIVRDDIQAAPSGMFLSFEGILSTVDKAKVNPYEKHSSQSSRSLSGSMESMVQGQGSPTLSGKNRWGLLKSIIPFSSSSHNPNRKTPKPEPSKILPVGRHRPDQLSATHALPSERRAVPYRSLSFKFSLEWADRNKDSSEKERRLTPPRLPPLAEAYSKEKQVNLYEPRKAEESAVASSKYAGRSIAEWRLLVTECKVFFERRRADGVPTNHLVEVPSLSVEQFRKL